MAHILIDGYNLIGTAHGSLEKARNDLIDQLQKYSQIKLHDITLVFDGWKNGHKDQTRIKAAHVTIIYSRLGETADVAIRKMLTPEGKPWIVVSSDREIYDFAARKDFAAITSDEFEDKLFRALHENSESIPDMQDDDDDDHPLPDGRQAPNARFKGNPRKLSKRDKKKQQALKKL
ncbi:YacP-like NYN domain protein [bacterium BMS3Bbin09]|nr:YacP-like NYN domain protein [bacterium BMS3Bbin09]